MINDNRFDQTTADVGASSTSHDEYKNRTIGAILVSNGKLSEKDIERISDLQEKKNLRFGDAAIELGLLTNADIDIALSTQFDYPYLLEGNSVVSQELIAAYYPFTPQVEALRALRSQLILRLSESKGKQKTLTIASAEPGEGRSFVAANLAVVFSQLGERTLLIDADMRNPRQHKLFGLNNRTGLSGILSDRNGLDAIQNIPSLEGLSVLASGPTPPNPQELLGRPQFKNMLDQMSQDYDVILIDTPAGEEYADAITVAVRTEATLLITRKDHSHINYFRKFAEDLAESDAVIVGTMLNDF